MCLACNSETFAPSRRSVLLGGLAALSASALPAFAQEQAVVSPDEALKRLLEGNARYVAGQRANTDFSVGRASRALTQRPFAAILSCADSRVAPELAFDQGPGDLFIVRVAGNFVNDDGLASLEYAINFLETPLIMVLGHSNCGAVAASIKVVRDGLALPGHLPDMIEQIRPAAETALAQSPFEPLGLAITINVQNAVTRLETAEPILAARVKNNSLRIVGAQYDLETGLVSLL
jgi:carbonic anhydrase